MIASGAAVPAALTDALAVSLVLPLLPPPDRPAARPLSPDMLRQGLLHRLERRCGRGSIASFHDESGDGGHPWTISECFALDGAHVFRLTALGHRAALLLEAVRPGDDLLHGWCVSASDRWRWASLADADMTDPGGHLDAVVALVSPTARRDNRLRADVPVDTLDDLTLSWTRRWLAHQPPEHPLSGLLAACEASELTRTSTQAIGGHLASQTRPTVKRTRSTGAVGVLRLRIAGPPTPERRALVALLRYAPFAGSGRRTAFGFGQTAVTVSRDGPPSRAPTSLPDVAAAAHEIGFPLPPAGRMLLMTLAKEREQRRSAARRTLTARITALERSEVATWRGLRAAAQALGP